MISDPARRRTTLILLGPPEWRGDEEVHGATFSPGVPAARPDWRAKTHDRGRVAGEGSGINLGNRQMAAIGDQPHEPIDRRRLIISTVSSLLILLLCLFLPAGTWGWFRGWLFLVVVVGASVVDILYLWRVNPDVIAG
jgi:hypothetical protein